MRRAPGYTAVAALSLALAIGANTAIFSLLDAVLLRQLPVAAPEQLVLIDGQYETGWSLISYPMYRDLAERQQVFTDVAAGQDYSAAALRVRHRRRERRAGGARRRGVRQLFFDARPRAGARPVVRAG